MSAPPLPAYSRLAQAAIACWCCIHGRNDFAVRSDRSIKLAAPAADILTLISRALDRVAGIMIDANVYYCWACDAHCRVELDSSGRAICSHCDRELSPDSRVPLRAAYDSARSLAPRNVWAAPLRPRLATSA